MTTRLKQDEVNDRLKNLKFNLVSDYKNRRTKCLIKCFCGNVFEQRPELIILKNQLKD